MQPYAVIFKAFKVDRFLRRQLARLNAVTPSGHVYVMIDETEGEAGPVGFERVIRYRNRDLTALGFAPHAHGALLWYNADYPLYYFQALHPEYDVVVMVEYDVVTNIDLDRLVREFRDKGQDFIAQPIQKPLDAYWWTKSMLHFYAREQVRPFLICIAVFSRDAIRHLADCRLEHGADAEVVDERMWPVGEAFVGTELTASGFSVQQLSAFGKLSHYDWWPPTHESELRGLADEAFIHPVLIGRRYVRSVFKNGYVTGLVAMSRRNLARMIFGVLRDFFKEKRSLF